MMVHLHEKSSAHSETFENKHKKSKNNNNQTIIYPLFQLRVIEALEPIPAATGGEVGYIQDQSPICHRANTHRQKPIHSYRQFRITS